MRLPRNAILVTFVLVIAIIISASFTSSPPKDRKFKNLKVLPKNISEHQLDSTMHAFSGGLGVKCDYCHVHAKDDPRRLDAASDEKPEKNIARHMYKMAKRINKKFFRSDKDEKGNLVTAVGCFTCHHGEAHPAGKQPKPGEIR